MIQLHDSIALDEHEIHERFVRAAGPAGQSLRKTASAVELRLDLLSSRLPADVKARLIILAGRRMTTDGVLVIVSRVHRSQAKNRDAAHERLVTLLKRAAQPPDQRVTGAPPAVADENRLASKHHQSAVKRRRTRGTPAGRSNT
jgi:ribosome-associated protein